MVDCGGSQGSLSGGLAGDVGEISHPSQLVSVVGEYVISGLCSCDWRHSPIVGSCSSLFGGGELITVGVKDDSLSEDADSL